MARVNACVVSLSLLLSACGPGTRQLTSNISYAMTPSDSKACTTTGRPDIFSAAPLCMKYPVGNGDALVSASDADTASLTDSTKAEATRFIGAALIDSFGKCSNFITEFTGTQSAENTLFDVAALTLSALGTVFIPSGTVRALSAATAITLGTKTAINTDLFQQVTVQLFVQQINVTYFKELIAYNTKIEAGQVPTASSALVDILAIHKDCSISQAAANISAAQKTQATSAPTPISAASVTAGSVFKSADGTTYTISAPAAGAPAGSIGYSITLPGGTSGPVVTAPASTVAALLTQLNAQKQ